MKRIKDEYLESIQKVLPFFGKKVLEIGSGNGSRSVQIAKTCSYLVAIEPDIQLVNFAKENNASQNIEYLASKAENLNFPDEQFDIVFFTLSLHHVPIEKMPVALDEAIRVTKKDGHIVFLEPTEDGSFFDAEITFDACDGDERKEKAAAYNAIKNHVGYQEIAEISDETVFQFDSLEDFVANMHPTREIEGVEDFLKKNNFILKASRRINICRVK